MPVTWIQDAGVGCGAGGGSAGLDGLGTGIDVGGVVGAGATGGSRVAPGAVVAAGSAVVAAGCAGGLTSGPLMPHAEATRTTAMATAARRSLRAPTIRDVVIRAPRFRVTSSAS